MKKLFKTAIAMLVMCVAFLSGIVCWLDDPQHYYAITDARISVVRMTGPLETKSEKIVYYQLKPDSVLRDTGLYSLLVTFELLYCNDCTPYTAHAAAEPGTSGTKQKIDSLNLWLMDGNVRRDITGELKSIDGVDHYYYEIRDFSGSKSWSRNCGDHDCMSYSFFPVRTLPDFRDSLNTNSLPKGHIGNGIDLVLGFDSAFTRSLPAACRLKLEVDFEGGHHVEAMTSLRKN